MQKKKKKNILYVMNPNMQFGSGSSLLGAGVSPELNAAMQARQTGQAGITAQQSPSSAGFDPSQSMASPTGGMPQSNIGGAPMGQDPNAQVSQNSSPQMPQSTSEAQLIIKTLASRLQSLSKGGILA